MEVVLGPPDAKFDEITLLAGRERKKGSRKLLKDRQETISKKYSGGTALLIREKGH